MIAQETVLVQLIRLADRVPTPPPPARRSPGRPIFYSDRLLLKALLIMIVRRLHKVGELLAVLEEPTPQMQTVRSPLSAKGRFPSRRTFERRLKALPQTLPEQIGCLGATWWRCFDLGRVRDERWRWTARCSRRKAACGTRRTARRARFLTPPSTPRRTGASPAGTGGCRGGSSTSPPPWPACGYRSPPGSPPPTSPIAGSPNA
jgi:hypothetical protein